MSIRETGLLPQYIMKFYNAQAQHSPVQQESLDNDDNSVVFAPNIISLIKFKEQANSEIGHIKAEEKQREFTRIPFDYI